MAMTLEKLKALLANKTIDQEDYDEAMKKYGFKEEEQKPDPLEKLDKDTRDAIEKMLQSERDRAANKVGNDKKAEIEDLKKQLEDLKNKAMDEDQRKKYDDEQNSVRRNSRSRRKSSRSRRTSTSSRMP